LKERIQEIIVEQVQKSCTEMPTQWFDIQMRLTHLQKTKKIKQLPLHKFKAMCNKVQCEKGSIQTLLHYFHNTGLFFYWKGLFKNQIVIDQKWVIDAV